MDGASTDSKVNLLFKEANNTVDVVRFEPFTNPQNAYPFQNYVQNDEIFSNNIPSDLSNISITIGSTTFYGSQALDISLSLAGQTDPSSIQLTPDLLYHYRIPLERASTQLAGTAPKRTWYVPDPTNPSRSLLSDAIAFNYDSVYNSYMPGLVDMCGNNQNPYYSGNVGAIWWRMDYKSGFVQLYGTDPNVDAFVPNINDAPRLSFIQYTGPKGAGIGGVVNGGDASFNNVDISDNLTVKHLTVTETANLPEETLIFPKWDGVEGSNTNVPQFPPGYPKTEQVQNFELDPSTNLITDQDWVTIAYCAENVPTRTADARADGVFKINYPRSSAHDTITFQASSKYGNGNGINVFQNDWYSNSQGSYDALRIVTKGIYDGALLQVRFKNPPSDGKGGAFTVRLWDNYDYPGWTIYNDTSGVSSSGIPIVTKDNNPVSQFERYDASGINIGHVALDQEHLIYELNWNPDPPNEKVNQVTRNPAFFQNLVRIDGQTEVNAPLYANDGLITNELITSTLTVGQSPNEIVNVTNTFYLDSSVQQGDWISIARIGEIQTTTLTQINHAAYGNINVFDHHAGNFHSVDILAGVMIEEGCVLEAVSHGHLVPNNTHVWKAARIVVANQYDGAILQLEVGPAAITGTSFPYRITLTNGRNFPGWKLSSGTLSDDSDPLIYSGSRVASGHKYSTFNNNWPRIPLNYAPTYRPDRRQETGKITSIPHRFEGARITVYGENMFCQKDLTSGFGGTLGSVDGLIYVESSQFGSYLSLGMDANNGNVKLSNNNGNSTPFNMYLEGEGNIVLDNQSTQSSGASNKGIALLSNDGVFIDCSNSSGNGEVIFRFGPSSNYQTMSLDRTGLDMNSHDISNVDAIYTKNIDIFDGDTSLNIGSVRGGFLAGTGQVNLECPMRLFNTSTAINTLGATSDVGSIAWSTTQSKIGVKFQNTSVTSNLNVKYLKYEETYELHWDVHGYIVLGIRQNNDPTKAFKRTFTWNKEILHHYSAEKDTLFNISSTTHGYFLKGNHHTIHRDTIIERVLVKSYNNYCRIKNQTGQSQTVTFETWIGITSDDDWSFNTTQNSGNYNIPADITNNNTSSSTCRRLWTYTRNNIASSSSSQIVQNPFTSGSGSPGGIDVTLATPLVVSKGSYVTLFCIERCTVAGASSSNRLTVEIENYLNGDNWGNAGVPMKWEFFGKQKSN